MVTKTLVGVGLAAALALPTGAALATSGDGVGDTATETATVQAQEQLRSRDQTCLVDGTTTDQAGIPWLVEPAGDRDRDRLHVDERPAFAGDVVGDQDRARDQLRDPDQCLLDGSGGPAGPGFGAVSPGPDDRPGPQPGRGGR